MSIGCRAIVCDFHRIQAWQRWLRTGKHNTAENSDECLELLKSVADADSEEEFEKKLQKLYSSHIWIENKLLQTYITDHYLSIKQVM